MRLGKSFLQHRWGKSPSRSWALGESCSLNIKAIKTPCGGCCDLSGCIKAPMDSPAEHWIHKCWLWIKTVQKRSIPPCELNYHMKWHRYGLTHLTKQRWGEPRPPRHAAPPREPWAAPAQGTGALLPSPRVWQHPAPSTAHRRPPGGAGRGQQRPLLAGSAVPGLGTSAGLLLTPARPGRASGSPGPAAPGSRPRGSSGALPQ